MRVAILAIDMSGFSRLMEEQGVDVALSAVARLQEVATAATDAHEGSVVKFWADNVLATFPTVSNAMKAAEATLALVPASAGIGFGEIHQLEADIFGVEVNRACRLGEDVAKRGELLLTDAAAAALASHSSSSSGIINGR